MAEALWNRLCVQIRYFMLKNGAYCAIWNAYQQISLFKYLLRPSTHRKIASKLQYLGTFSWQWMASAEKSRPVRLVFLESVHKFWLWSWHRDKNDPKTSLLWRQPLHFGQRVEVYETRRRREEKKKIWFCHFEMPTISSINPSSPRNCSRRVRTHQNQITK